MAEDTKQNEKEKEFVFEGESIPASKIDAEIAAMLKWISSTGKTPDEYKENK